SSNLSFRLVSDFNPRKLGFITGTILQDRISDLLNLLSKAESKVKYVPSKSTSKYSAIVV
ncbi:hypothetical protein COX24_03930, partial [bacterium (Candidatus Gribaldobacteria) CG23_combo_of_CG06-09_8_20_14_all_37_87_8]